MGRVEVRARPGSRQDRIAWDDGRRGWVVACRDPPTEGRANDAIVQLLADRLGVPRRSVRIVIGGRTRHKTVEVDGVSDEEIAVRLRRASSPSSGKP